MRPRRGDRTDQRRDGGVRQIRTDGAVRYPGVDLPPDVAADRAVYSRDVQTGDSRRLAPARDTGIEVQSRASRQQGNTARRRRAVAIAWVLVLALLISAAIAWRYASDRTAAATPLTAETGATSGAAGSLAAHKSAGGLSPTAASAATPIFASYGKLKLHLPVPLASLTEIGFHQASYAWALPMKTPMKDANLTLAAKNKSTGRDISKQRVGGGAVMTGYVVRMWRNRPGRPDTAADVGALPGTTVLAPVSGTIVKIKSYKLYGKYPDYELHIHPDGTSGLDLVMIHLTNLSCSVGDHVDAGVSALAEVRKLSDKFHDQLASYTHSGGDHVHIQVNNADYRGYKGLYGAISASQGSSSSGGATGATGVTTGTGAPDYSTSGD